MALSKNKTITLNGYSKVGDEQVIAQHFTATITDGVTINTNASVTNQEAYNANLETCREDKDAFEAWTREVEDAMKEESATV